MKTAVKVAQMPADKYVLHMYLRPGYCVGFDRLIWLVMRRYNMTRKCAEDVVCDTVSMVDYYNLTWHDREKLGLPGL